MEQVENQIFYHIKKKSNGIEAEAWKQNQHIIVGENFNRFYYVMEKQSTSFDPNNNSRLRSALGYSNNIIRELIYEDVRRLEFSDYPSRQKCLWVVQEGNVNSLQYWLNILGEDQKIYRLSLSGKIHEVDQRKLTGDTLQHGDIVSLEYIRQKAREYWVGAEVGFVQNEILFEGTGVVLEEIDKYDLFKK